MGIKLKDKDVTDIKYGTKQVTAVYYGTKLVWSKPDTASTSQTK